MMPDEKDVKAVLDALEKASILFSGDYANNLSSRSDAVGWLLDDGDAFAAYLRLRDRYPREES